jgi:hypothetical protein
MKPLVQCALLAGLLAFSQGALAGSRSASFQATFTIVESCAVQANDRQPAVQCQFATPFSVSKTAQQPTVKVQPELAEVRTEQRQDSSQPQIWTVTF